MKMIDFDTVLKRANELYREKKMKNHPDQRPWPEIESNQVKAALQALIEALNEHEDVVNWDRGML